MATVRKGYNCGSCALSDPAGGETLMCVAKRQWVYLEKPGCEHFVEFESRRQAKQEMKKWINKR